MGFLAPVAPFIPSIFKGIGGLFGGGGDKEEEQQQRFGWDKLKQTYDTALPLGQQLSKTGAGTVQGGLQTLQQPEQYWSTLLQGSRPAVMAAMAPEVSAINEADAAQRSQEGWFGTSRGGGTAAANREAETRRMSAIDRAIFGARQPAAEGLQQIGTTKASIGLQQLSTALRSIGLSQDAVRAILESAGKSRSESYAQRQNMMADIGEAIGDAIGVGEEKGWFD